MEQLTGSKLGKEDDKAAYSHLLIYFIRRVRAKPLSRVLLFATPWTVATRLLCPWDSPGKNTRGGCHILLQGIFSTQGSYPGLMFPALAGGFFTLAPPIISLVAQMVKNLPAMQETWVWSLDQEDALEEEMATHSSILGWRIPWTEEPGRLQSMGSQRV